jgi:beta-galactosidase GanA
LISASVASAQGGRPIPRLERSGNQYHFLVDGQPFLMLAAQAHNSSATSAQQLEPFWKSLVAIHGNTGEVPLYWELIEPQPAKFDFHLSDDIVAAARRKGLRLVFLWFGTWKNGDMDYTPEWLKRDRATYERVIGARGQEMWIISPVCEAARDADARAFHAVMEHIRSIDEQDRTVIMMQVENETGLVGTDRDYSEEATRLFRGPVPADLIAHLSKNRDNLSASFKAAWAATSFRSSGTWTEVFGGLAPEAFSAWHVARYVDAGGGRQAGLPVAVLR